jgi:hypothetical protein
MLGINEVYVSSYLPTDIKKPPKFKNNDVEKFMDAKDFFLQRMVYMEGAFASRADIINFTANKLGGTHNPEPEKNKKLQRNPLYNFDEIFGLAVLGSNIQMMREGEFKKISDYKKQGRVIYNIYHLVTLDTARRFVRGVKGIEQKLVSLNDTRQEVG